MTLKPGRCLGCEALVWRIGVQQKKANAVPAGTEFLLWPLPSAKFARFRVERNEHEQIYAAIPFCAICATEAVVPILQTFLGVGEGVLEWEPARTRYAAWYAEDREAFYRAWLRDQVQYEEAEIEKLMQQWQEDRAA